MSFENFLALAREKHQERFLYDRSSWKGMSYNLRICCSAHGWFEQTGAVHLRSKGCRCCSNAENGQRRRARSLIDFINKAKTKFGERFEYQKSSWKGTNVKMDIYCSSHGWFEQVPYDHLKFSGGCWSCANIEMGQRMKEKSKKKFISMASKKHKGKYEYDLEAWDGYKGKLKIKCPIHGWFEQVPYDHLKYCGCFRCGVIEGGKKLRTPVKEIVARFRKTHGNKYSYKNLEYKTSSEKVTITCRLHGNFLQKASDHERGDGCPRCGGRHRWSNEEFIENSKRVHPDKFTYEKTFYSGALEEVTITCKIHGDFTSHPSRHILKKAGCKKCSPSAPVSKQDFLNRAHARFGDRYDYSLIHFVNVATPVQIICKTHGVFEQPPSWHLSNAIGCPQCTYSVSTKETRWLDSLNLPESTKRHTSVLMGSSKRRVDAYDHSTKTVYEFWGDWWHGHPDYFDPTAIHPMAKVTYGELYQKTMEKRKLIIASGYKLVEIWEHEFDKIEGRVGKRPRQKKKD